MNRKPNSMFEAGMGGWASAAAAAGDCTAVKRDAPLIAVAFVTFASFVRRSSDPVVAP
jgi:hypothetical protein